VTVLLFIAAALLGAMGASELALRGTKLQTGLARVLVAWGAVYAVTMVWLRLDGEISPLAFTILWGGSFLTWFGVRSHLESSILLRMLVFLRREPMSEGRLVARYLSQYGEAVRVEELCRGGLARRDRDQISVTPKGKRILRVVSTLR
jgi:hypothetical protein